MLFDPHHLLESIIPAVEQAGQVIMEIYNGRSDIDTKADGSPVTKADKAAERIVLSALIDIAPEIPIVSEENAESHLLAPPERFFLVDPLDGTREFIKRDGNGSFTVNVALIENGDPVLGVVYAPALDKMFTGVVGAGAKENGEAIKVSQRKGADRKALASVSHRDSVTDEWLKKNPAAEILSVGSSLKFGLIANGDADVYPRFGPTMEWDTAAGHAVLLAAGGTMTQPDGTPFTYGKSGYKNGPFIASNG